MKHFQSGNNYVLVFQKGEQFIAKLTGFCKEHGIKAGFFHGLGGVLSAELGYYDMEEREYGFRRFDQVMEIASLQGNVAFKDDETFVHAHAVLSDTELQAYGGHIRELTVGGTCEIRLCVFESPWHREYDEETGLSLIKFSA